MQRRAKGTQQLSSKLTLKRAEAKTFLFPKKRFSFFCPKYGLPVIVCDDFLTEENLFLGDHLKCFFQGMVHVFYSTAMFAITQKAQSGWPIQERMGTSMDRMMRQRTSSKLCDEKKTPESIQRPGTRPEKARRDLKEEARGPRGQPSPQSIEWIPLVKLMVLRKSNKIAK